MVSVGKVQSGKPRVQIAGYLDTLGTDPSNRAAAPYKRHGQVLWPCEIPQQESRKCPSVL